MKPVFYLLWAAFLLVPQMAVRMNPASYYLNLGLISLLLIYISFAETFIVGLASVVVISYFAEIFSSVPHGYFMLNHLILFVGIQLIVDRIFTEAYLTKSLWVFPLSVIGQFLTAMTLDPSGSFLGNGSFWVEQVLQGAIISVMSLPLFIILDFTAGKWEALFSRQRAHFTGADIYQLKSKQRKYF